MCCLLYGYQCSGKYKWLSTDRLLDVGRGFEYGQRLSAKGLCLVDLNTEVLHKPPTVQNFEES